MAYRIVQKKGESHYLYEAESFWDPEKKKTVQHRRYLGRCDADGNLIAESKRYSVPEASKNFGAYYALLEIADSSGIYGDLVKTLGETEADLAISIAIMRVIRGAPMRQILNQLDESFLPELLGMNRPTLNDISSMLTDIGSSDTIRDRFASLRNRGDGSTVYDIVYSDITENRDSFFYCAECRTARLPKKNILVAYSDSRKLPFALRMCSSNITDMGSIRDTDAYLKGMGVKHTGYILSSASYNPLDIVDMIDAGMDFTTTVPLYTQLARGLLKKASNHFYGTRDTEDYNGYTIKCYECESDLDGRGFRAIILEEEDRRYEETVALNKKMDYFESHMRDMRWYPGILADLERSPYSDMLHLFSITEGFDGTAVTERLHERILEMRDRCGKLVILTTSEGPWREVLAGCKKRDSLNSFYTILRDDVEARAKFIPTPEASEGMINVELLSIMIRDELLNRLRSHEDGRKMWSHDYLSEMSKLKITRSGGRWVLNTVSAEQRRLLDMTDVRMPFLEYGDVNAARSA